MIVALAYACSKPDTVVIKSQYAVVTDMAVRSSRGSKYITSFTIFKLKKQVSLHVYLMVKYSIVFV